MTLQKANLSAIKWTNTGTVEKIDKPPGLEVQFNPASLKVSYSNQIETGGSSIQLVGKGDSKLAVELIFDVSGVNPDNIEDVREMTNKIAYFIKTEPYTPKAASDTDNSTGGTPTTPVNPPSGGSNSQESQEQGYVVPGLRFHWGSFLFDGILVSMDETLELWSENGVPLRAIVSLNISQPGIHFDFGENSEATPSPQGTSQAGTTPLTPSPQGANLQSMVANTGTKTDWKAIAALNGIENPRNLAPGTLVNFRAGARANLVARANARIQAGGAISN